jgi:hypothetical protein
MLDANERVKNAQKAADKYSNAFKEQSKLQVRGAPAVRLPCLLLCFFSLSNVRLLVALLISHLIQCLLVEALSSISEQPPILKSAFFIFLHS